MKTSQFFRIPVNTPRMLALSVALGLFASAPAHALSITKNLDFGNTNSVQAVDGESSGSTSTSNTKNDNVTKFNPNVGVLTGVTVSGNFTVTTNVTAANASGSNGGLVKSQGKGSGTVNISAPGISDNTLVTQEDTCDGQKKDACNDGLSTSSTTSVSISALDDKLNDYVGASGSVNISRTIAVTAEQQSSVFNGSETTTAKLLWDKTSDSLVYDYLNHSTASFDSTQDLCEITLDFGDVAFGESKSLDYTINDIASQGIGLDLIDVTGSSNTFNNGLSPYINPLVPGSGFSIFSASIDTSVAGTFFATYTLYFSDQAVGASASRYNYLSNVFYNNQFDDNERNHDGHHGSCQTSPNEPICNPYILTLNLTGHVLEQPAIPAGNPISTIPEPELLSLLSLGFTALVFGRKPRKQA